MWSLKFSRRKLVSRKSSKKRSGAAQFRLPLGQHRFGIEPLEPRTLLTTGTIAVVGGVLTITSGAGQNNSLTIGLDASTAIIDISDSAGNNYNISGISNTTGSGTNFLTIPVASVLGDNIAVATGDQTDSLTVNLANGNPAQGVENPKGIVCSIYWLSCVLLNVGDWEKLAGDASYEPEKVALLCSVTLRQLERFFQLNFAKAPPSGCGT